MLKKCFVIMPFSQTTDDHTEEYWNKFYNLILRIMKKNDYECSRSEIGPYNLFSNIVKKIKDSDVVISILSDFNPNVFYELGIRHTLRQGTIMLLQRQQKLPFDINDYGIIFYDSSDIDFQEKLEESITNYLSKLTSETVDSPVIDILQKIPPIIEKKYTLDEIVKIFTNELSKYVETQNKTPLTDNHTKQNRILWVDDYPINNEAIRNLFENIDIKFDLALTTEQGIQYYQKNKYDLIITDMGRGSENDAGIQLIKKLNDCNCITPIVVYTSANGKRIYENAAIYLGAYAVISGVKDIITIILSKLDIDNNILNYPNSY